MLVDGHRILSVDLEADGAGAHARDANLAEQGHERPRMQPLVRQADRSALAGQDDRLADVTVPARVDVRLQREPEDLAAAAL